MYRGAIPSPCNLLPFRIAVGCSYVSIGQPLSLWLLISVYDIQMRAGCWVWQVIGIPAPAGMV